MTNRKFRYYSSWSEEIWFCKQKLSWKDKMREAIDEWKNSAEEKQKYKMPGSIYVCHIPRE